MRKFLCAALALIAVSAFIAWRADATQVGRDSNGVPFDLFELGDTQTWTFPAQSSDDDSRTAPTTFSATTRAIRVVCNQNVNIAQSATPATATTGNILLASGTAITLAVHAGNSIAVHAAGGNSGTCWLSQLR